MAKPKPATKALLVCPMTGAPIEVRRICDGLKWIGVCESPAGRWQTQTFDTREEVVWFVSHRAGVAPAFPRRIRIEVRERTPPAPDALEDLRRRNEELNDATEDLVERVVHDAGGLAGRGR